MLHPLLATLPISLVLFYVTMEIRKKQEFNVSVIGRLSLLFSFIKCNKRKSYARPTKYDFLVELALALNILTISIDVFKPSNIRKEKQLSPKKQVDVQFHYT